jgi:hypothetical protein
MMSSNKHHNNYNHSGYGAPHHSRNPLDLNGIQTLYNIVFNNNKIHENQ